MSNRYQSNELIDTAVKKALAYNSSSSVMFLLRERMIREIIEISSPILAKPLLERIAELEARLVGHVAVEPPVVERPPKKVSAEQLIKLREALNGMAEVIDGDV